MEPAENQQQALSKTHPEIPQEQALSKTETLKLLNDSIDRLEQTIKGIKEDKTPVPSSGSINTLLSTTQELAEGVAPLSNETVQPKKITTDTTAAQKSVTKNLSTSKTSRSKTAKPKTAEATSKSTSVQRNTVLIVIGVTAIAIIIVVVLWLWSPFPQKSLATLPEIIAEEVGSPLSSEFSASEVVETLPNVEPETIATIEPVTETSVKAEEAQTNLPTESSAQAGDISIPAIPTELKAPGRSKNLKMLTIEPELKFTPEQKLLGALQSKLVKLGQSYPDNLIDSVLVDLPQQKLLVQVTNDWYGLSQSRQSQIGNDLLKLSRRLSFQKLALQDHADHLVARNPVIGEAIILIPTNQ